MERETGASSEQHAFERTTLREDGFKENAIKGSTFQENGIEEDAIEEEDKAAFKTKSENALLIHSSLKL